MKKRALYLLAVVIMVLASSAANVAVSPDGPMPLCNPFTDPQCK